MNEGRGTLRALADEHAYKKDISFYKKHINFVVIVKYTFLDDLATFKTFLDLLKKSECTSRITRYKLVKNLQILFKGKMHLMTILRLSLKDDSQNLHDGYNEICCLVSRIESEFEGIRDLINVYVKGKLTFLDVYEEMAIRFKDRTDLLQEFIRHFFPVTSGLDKGFNFLCKVKGELQGLLSENYRKVVLFLHIFCINVITAEQLRLMMLDIFGDHTELMDDFVLFMMRCKKKDGFLSYVLRIVCSTSEGLLNVHRGIVMNFEDRMKLMDVEDWDESRCGSLYLKSLDEESFKDEILISEIKAINEQDRKICIEKGGSIVAHMEFDYPDLEIHEDIRKLLITVFGQGFDVEVWTSFIEPFIGASSNSHSAVNNSEYRVLYGSDDFYVLFRLHRILYERLYFVKNTTVTMTGSADDYTRFIYSFYESSKDDDDSRYSGTTFEDDCRTLLGTQSAVLLTIQDQILNLGRKFGVVVNNGINKKLCQLYRQKLDGKLSDDRYSISARYALRNENAYRIDSSFQHLSIHHIEEVSNVFQFEVTMEEPDSSFAEWFAAI